LARIGTLFKSGSIKVVINEITKYKLNNVALQEMRCPGNGSIKEKDTTFFYSGCNDNRHGTTKCYR